MSGEEGGQRSPWLLYSAMNAEWAMAWLPPSQCDWGAVEAANSVGHLWWQKHRSKNTEESLKELHPFWSKSALHLPTETTAVLPKCHLPTTILKLSKITNSRSKKRNSLILSNTSHILSKWRKMLRTKSIFTQSFLKNLFGSSRHHQIIFRLTQKYSSQQMANLLLYSMKHVSPLTFQKTDKN